MPKPVTSPDQARTGGVAPTYLPPAHHTVGLLPPLRCCRLQIAQRPPEISDYPDK